MARRTIRRFACSWLLALVLVGLAIVSASLGSGLVAGEAPRVHPLNAKPVVKTPQLVAGTGSDQSVFLGGQFIEVGIHYAGSFGASAAVPPGFHPTQGWLGFVVDGDGFDSGNDPVVGDFFVPGDPEEVWGVEWNSEDGAITLMNAGLMEGAQIPTDEDYPKDISNLSEGDHRSVWRGIAVSPQSADEQLTITQTVSFRSANKFFVINVVLTNTGRSNISGLKYLRSVDADQDAIPPANVYTTSNYIVAQPGSTANRALVIARGPVSGVPLGLGTIDARARVSHGGFSVRSASDVLAAGTIDSPLSVSGTEANPSNFDEAISLAFDLGDLVPGQSVSIDYAYILDAADLEIALGQLARVTILQPTGTVSGNNALFQVATDNPDAATLKVDFYVAGILVGTDDSASRDGIYEVTFNTLTLQGGEPLPNGPVTIEAVATFDDDSTSRKSASVTVDNAGPPIDFTGSTPAQDATVVGSQIPIEVSGTDVEYLPAQVTIFREVLGTPVVLAALTQAPFVATLDVTDLPENTVVTIKAVASNQSGTASTTISRTVVSALVPPGEETEVPAPSVPLSEGDRVIYVAVSPGTPQGRTSLLSVLTGTDQKLTRSYYWNPSIDEYVEVRSQSADSFQVSTGFFIATRVPLNFNLDGTSVGAPPTLTLPPSGWVLAGVPPYDNGEGPVTDFQWSDTHVALGGETLDDTTEPTLADAMGIPGGPSSSALPYLWDGTDYVRPEQLHSGKAYWFKNNLDQPLVLTFGQPAQAQFLTQAKNGAKRLTGVTVRVRDQGAPPPPPSSAKASSSSSGGGCGAGSGVAGLVFLLLLGYGLLISRR